MPEHPRSARIPGLGLPLLAALMLLWLAACSSPPGYLDQAEQQYGVGTTWYGSNLRIFHAALLEPEAVALRYPGYVIGVENIHPADRGFLDAVRARQWREHHVITHVMRYNLGGEENARPCALYALLDRDLPPNDPAHRVFERCAGAEPPSPAAAGGESTAQGIAVDRFRRSLAQTLAGGRFSHILVLVMGWNTDQEKALANFNSLVGNLAAEAGPAFRPLVIGVTWPSQWQLNDYALVPAAVVRGVSFPFKRRDANDLGSHVLHDLILHAVLVARDQAAHGGAVPPLVMIGHSFGARALVTALTRTPGGGPDVNEAGAAPFRPEDRMILLQGAFEFRYLFDDRGALDRAFASGAPRLTMTASAHDSAVSTAFWGWYAGDIDTFDQACRVNASRWDGLGVEVAQLGCGVARQEGSPAYGLDLCAAQPPASGPLQRPLAGKPVRYVDATRLIDCRPPFGGGGAHSDVFRRETARFILDELRP